MHMSRNPDLHLLFRLRFVFHTVLFIGPFWSATEMYLFGPLRATPFWSIIGAVMKQTDPQYKLRLSQELKDQIEAAAKQSGRSMNAEIVARLEGSFNVTSSVLESVPRVLETLERALDNAALERGVLKLNLNSLSEAVSLLVQSLDAGGQLEPDHRARLLDLAARCKTDIKDTKDFLFKVQDEIDANTALTAELGVKLIEELELSLNPKNLAPSA